MNRVYIDFETKSTKDLKKIGAWAYALDPSTDILCLGFKRPGDKEISILTAAELRAGKRLTVPDGTQLVVHNASFEYAVWNIILHRRYGHPPLWEPHWWNCSMSRAAMVGLPLDLDSLGRILQIKTPKDLNGRRVMHQLCKPVGYDAGGKAVYDNDPDKLARLYAYNATDVKAEMEIDALLPELPPAERAVWELDLVMNRRGVQIDTDFAAKAAAMSDRIVDDLNAKLRAMTGGYIDKATRVTAIKEYLKANGVTVPVKTDADGEEKESLGKASMLGLLERKDLSQKIRDVIIIRQQVGKSTSTAKYAKALEMVCRDGRVRGSLQYHAAHTGRFGGRLIQPQNMPKGFGLAEQTAAIDLILAGDCAAFTAKYGIKAMDALSDSLRGLIVAGPGKTLVAADYNAIEARVNFWLADDVAALTTYRKGGSPYFDMGEFIFKRPITKKDAHEYAVSKMTILGAGFGMGAKRFRDQCAVAQPKPVVISEELAKTAIRAFREKYSSVVQMWYAVENAAINAVKNPGTNYPCCGGRVLWGMSQDRRFLVCRLPSGRYLWYWKPTVKSIMTKWEKAKEELHYWGFDSQTKQWCELKTYGAALVENTTQATARDLMVAGMIRVEKAGYEMNLTVHDELVAEFVPAPDKTLEKFIQIMCITPGWADGCPVAAEGWIGGRYRK